MKRKPGKLNVSTAGRRRSAARLAAVQALYHVELTDTATETVLRDFLERRLGGEGTHPATEEDGEDIPAPLLEPDSDLLALLVRGTLAQKALLDEVIGNALSRDLSVDRLETLLLSILRAGAFELKDRPDVPVRVVISEYVDVAHAFYSGPEPGLVNAVLDRIARAIRSEELSANG